MCVVDTEGGLWCWGTVDEEVGAGPGSGDGRPYRLLGDVDIADVDSGGFSFCALSAEGTVYCWGANHAGKLGTGGPHESYVSPAYRFPTPTRVEVEDGVVFTQVSAGRGSTCAIDDNAALWCWGADLMVDPWRFPLIPPRGNHVRPVLYDDQHTWKSVSVGVEHLCGLVDGQQVRCFGSNRSGVLGDPDIPEEQTGQTMLTELEGAAQTAERCALVSEEVWCWGYTAAGLSGDPSRVAPVRVEFPRAVQDRALRAVGVTNSSAWHDSAEVTIWGRTEADPYGFELPTTLTLEEPFSFMTDYYGHGCGIGAETGTLYCRGDSELLGPNYDTFQDEFVPVP